MDAIPILQMLVLSKEMCREYRGPLVKRNDKRKEMTKKKEMVQHFYVSIKLQSILEKLDLVLKQFKQNS